MGMPLPSDLFPKRRFNDEEQVLVPAPDLLPVQPEREADESTRARRGDYQLGNPELPITSYREQILEAVQSSQVVIITTETGAGKSTQVPQYLAEAGHKVVLTQPRRPAVRSIAARIAQEIRVVGGTEFDEFVGYEISGERDVNDDNQVTVLTDGLQLHRELSNNGVVQGEILVVDEVHEWNKNIEVLLALAQKRLRKDPSFKIVVMSATMDTKGLAEYFTESTGSAVPVIDVPGRTYEVKIHEGGRSLPVTIQCIQEGKNPLVFMRGKAEIERFVAALKNAQKNGVIPSATTILPLHGEMEKSQQQRVFDKCKGVKVVVSTNVAETSLTIPDIRAVVDTGDERRIEVRDGIEGLYVVPVSRSSCLQRAGRAGRTDDGEYHLVTYGDEDFVALDDREKYRPSEILRSHLDSTVLSLAKARIDAAELDFPSARGVKDFPARIAAAKERLQKLGALHEDGTITPIGSAMERMPLESHYARMMVEARQYGEEVQQQLAALLAVQEAGGVCQFSTVRRPCAERWRSLIMTEEQDSDPLKQLEVFVNAGHLSKNERREHDILMRNYDAARDVYERLISIERLGDDTLPTLPTPEQREQIIRCVISGMVDNLYCRTTHGYVDARGNIREVGNSRILKALGPMIVATPFDLQVPSSYGSMVTLKLTTNITNVPSAQVLREVAPQLFTESRLRFVSQYDGTIAEEWAQKFNGQTVGQTEVRKSNPSEARKDYIIGRVIASMSQYDPYRTITEEIYRLQLKTTDSLRTITHSDVKGMLDVALPISVSSIDDARYYLPEVSIDDVLPLEERMRIDDENPDVYLGIPLHYEQGTPYVPSSVQPDELVDVFGGVSTLPNGKQIIYGSRYSARSLELVVREATIARENARLAYEKAQLDAAGAEQGLPGNIQIWRRAAGATRRGMGWVIQADGSLRPADTVPTDRYNRSGEPDGMLIWDQIRPGELVVSWGKADVISPHSFKVIHVPKEGLTDAQLQQVRAIEDGIDRAWSSYNDRKNDPRGDRSSPPVGRGWGLLPYDPERVALLERLRTEADQLYSEMESIDTADLPDGLLQTLNRLADRMYRLCEPRAEEHHDYPNQLKSMRTQFDALKREIKAQTPPQSVTEDSLAALLKKFNG
ncbi:MAG: helicase-related protein [Candidatus Saccharimonas sp.]